MPEVQRIIISTEVGEQSQSSTNELWGYYNRNRDRIKSKIPYILNCKKKSKKNVYTEKIDSLCACKIIYVLTTTLCKEETLGLFLSSLHSVASSGCLCFPINNGTITSLISCTCKGFRIPCIHVLECFRSCLICQLRLQNINMSDELALSFL